MQLSNKFNQIKNKQSLRDLLTSIEVMVLDMTAQGLDSVEIANQLKINYRDVDQARVSIYKQYMAKPETANKEKTDPFSVASSPINLAVG